MRLSGTKTGSANQYNGLGDQLYDLGGARPTLDLNFANNGSLVDSVTGKTLVQHTRQSNATYVDGDGVIRTATTNLLLRSEEFDNTAVWGNSVGTITRNANTEIAPNGTLTADNLVFAAADNSVAQAVTIVSGVSYAVSIWIKGTAGQTIRLSANNIPGGSNVTLTGDWVRYSFVGVSTGTSATLNISTFGGVTARNIYVWGAQLEQSTTVGEYIPTTSTINSAPRFDHDPTTGESLGLLVEESRTNLLTYSEEFDNAAWMKARVTVTANAVAAPDGTTTAEKLIANTANDSHFLFQGGSFVSGVEYVLSVFAKKEEWDFIRLGFPSDRFAGSGRSACFDLNNGTVGDTQSGVTASIVNFNNGWYRCSIKATANSTGASSTGVAFNPQSVDSAVSQSIAGDDTSGIYLWGAQLEAGSFPTSYIPTTTAEATRAADVASISGNNFSSWYRQDEGTLFAEAAKSQIPVSNSTTFADLNDGTTNNRSRFWIWSGASSTLRFTPRASNADQADLTIGIPVQNVVFKAAGALKADNFGAVLNGGTVSVDTSGTVPTVDRLTVGNSGSANEQLGGHLRRLTYWPQRLPNDTLQTITT